MKRLILIGASGSIGSQTLDVIRQHPEELQLIGLSVGYNIDFLVQSLKEFRISYAYTIEQHDELKDEFPDTVF